ncbi:MAG: hypothetical protein LAO09_21410 [Acidobacteriia bacterium]|nr:hypothetical protein [Terriglobia bacterium]
MSIQDANFEDLLKAHYVESAGSALAGMLESIRRGELPSHELDSFPLARPIGQSSAILFSPVISLLRFYSLLEIALLGKFVPEPDYMSTFWKETADNLSLLLAESSAEPDDYSTVLPRFLLGRLEGRMHLEEEGIDARYGELTSIFLSFLSLISRWRNPDIGLLLRFILSPDTSDIDLERFRIVVSDKDDFMSRILAVRSEQKEFPDRLLQGLSGTLGLCEDLDRLLEDSKPFPLVQSAMWTYHADLFSTVGGRLPSYLMAVVTSFVEWTTEEPESERATAITSYVENVKEFMGRLSSGAYGHSLRPDVLRPTAPAMA